MHGHWDLVPGLLRALAAQSLAPADILLADNEALPPDAAPDAAADPTRALAPDLAPDLLSPLPVPARILPAPGPGSYAARNIAARAALAGAPEALLAFTDADCRPDPGWLAALAAGAAAHPGALLAGPVRMEAPARWTAAATFDRLRGIPQARYVARGYAATANLAVPGPVFAALGGFDASRRSGGDAEFCRRAGAAGHPLHLLPDAGVSHPVRADWAGLAVKARRVKGGQVAAGPRRRRLAWVLRSLCPPVTDSRALLGAPAPWRDRLVALAVRFALWGVELAEVARLLAGGRPERR